MNLEIGGSLESSIPGIDPSVSSTPPVQFRFLDSIRITNSKNVSAVDFHLQASNGAVLVPYPVIEPILKSSTRALRRECICKMGPENLNRMGVRDKLHVTIRLGPSASPTSSHGHVKPIIDRAAGRVVDPRFDDTLAMPCRHLSRIVQAGPCRRLSSAQRRFTATVPQPHLTRERL